jgi:hypothetical protein
VVVEGEVYPGHIGKVGRNVAIGDLDEPILHVFGVDEGDLIEDPELGEQGGADQPVEVAACDKAALLKGVGCHQALSSFCMDVQT